MLDTYDLILCMERLHKERILSAYPHIGQKVHVLTEYLAPEPPTEPDIQDPYGGTMEEYERCYRRIRTEVERIAWAMLKESHAENAE